jgi:hypothetical protein
MVTTAVLQVAVPVMLLAWLWWGYVRGVALLVRAGAVLGVLAMLLLVTPWLDVPPFVAYAWLLLWPVAAWCGWRRGRLVEAGSTWWSRLGTGTCVALGICAWGTAALAVDARRVPASDVVDLACPLPPGVYRVVNGGSRLIVNAHLATLEPVERYRRWRGQSYGVDLVQVDGFGRRARSPFSPNLADYFIYGREVLAPCDGRVVAAADGRPDMRPGVRDPDRDQLAGNFVLLGCGAHEVLLAHLQPGSVRVTPGEEVNTGALVGFVGNSGNTDEPHLHVSVQRRDAADALVGGEPAPLTLAGDFRVRNDRIRCE